ncbi:MAG: MBL fold metallo-hydrolase [Spirochaetales bacterium]|nr:MBL fold metallo-hydrolase [Spirochaetales bacterium]
MRKILLRILLVLFLLSGCYRSWDGLHFRYSEIEKEFKTLKPLDGKENKAFLYAVKYGVSKFPEASIFKGGDTQKKLDFHWLFYLIKSENSIILVDTGFSDMELAEKYGVILKDPVELLHQAGINPEDVTDVIITHAHFDHIGTADRYKNARIYIHEDAFNSFIKSRTTRQTAQNMKESGNLYTFSDKTILFDSILIYPVGGHAPGSSAVFFIIDKTRFALIGDEAYLSGNITEQKPVGVYEDLQRNIIFLKELQDLENTTKLTFHDPAVAPGDFGLHLLK